jgi:hypothetical protein
MSRIESKEHATPIARRPARGARVPRITVACVVAAATALAALLAMATPAAACPSCATGQQARSEVLAGDFGIHLLEMALPFLVIGALCVPVDAIGRRRPPAGEREREREKARP